MHFFTCMFYHWYHIKSACTNAVPKEKKQNKTGDHFLMVCKSLELQLDCQFPPKQFDKLLISSTINVTFTVTKRNTKTSPKTIMSEWCSLLQHQSATMDIMSSVILLKEIGFFLCTFFSSWSHYPSEMGSVVAHLTATGSSSEKYVDKMSATLSFFFTISLRQEKQLKGMNCVKNSLSTFLPYWIRQKQNHIRLLTIAYDILNFFLYFGRYTPTMFSFLFFFWQINPVFIKKIQMRRLTFFHYLPCLPDDHICSHFC